VAKTMMEFVKEFEPSKSEGRDGGESAGSLAEAGKKRKRSERLDANGDEDISMEPPASPKDVRPPRSTQVSRNDPTPSSEAITRSATAVPVTGMSDRLAAIRTAKEKLASNPISLPPVGLTVHQASLNSLTYSTKPKMESNPLENALMRRMNSSLSMGSNRAPGPNGGESSLTQSRRSSPRGRSRDRDRDKDRDRDGEKAIRGRSVSSERSNQTRRPHDGTYDRDYKSNQGRDRQYSGGHGESKGTRDDYR
jgi:hypothetical protein